jgi:hypothetical protein
VPYFLIPIEATDVDRVRGLLAVAGVQNVGNVSARLSADDAESATDRVRRALEGEPVELGQPIEAE